MGLILNIDTSTEVCSVALAKDSNLISLKENVEGMNHSTLLGVFVDEILKENNLTSKDLDAISVSMGPGSYTGLRIGVSLSKGLCYGSNKPLISVGTLDAMGFTIANTICEEAWFCPMIDARRMEVYTALYNHAGQRINDITAEIIDEFSFKDLLSKQKIFFFGNGSAKTKTLINHPNAFFLEDIITSATNMIKLSEDKYNNNEFENIAYFEPYYLKDFVTTTSKKKLF